MRLPKLTRLELRIMEVLRIAGRDSAIVSGSLCKVYGAITFALENPEGIECYLRDEGRLWQELREKHPLPARIRDALLQAGKSQS